MVGASHEEAAIDEHIQDRDAGGAVERPEPLRLFTRELKARHLQTLALNATNEPFQTLSRHFVTHGSSPPAVPAVGTRPRKSS